MADRKKNIIIMNFSHVYEDEEILHKQNYIWMDCSDLTGTDCYLDESAEEVLKQRMNGYSPEGIHFIDSGNYHYVSKLWTDKIHMPFSLIVFDHHTDMQQGSLFELISCGSWVKAVLDKNPYLRKVILFGVKEELLKEIPEAYQERVITYGEQQVKQPGFVQAFTGIHLKEPVYISIDKDVLKREEAVTNWDQGSLSIKQLKQLLVRLCNHESVIGIDICGEAAINEPLVKQRMDDAMNNRVNGELLALLEGEEKGEYEEASNY